MDDLMESGTFKSLRGRLVPLSKIRNENVGVEAADLNPDGAQEENLGNEVNFYHRDEIIPKTLSCNIQCDDIAGDNHVPISTIENFHSYSNLPIPGSTEYGVTTAVAYDCRMIEPPKPRQGYNSAEVPGTAADGSQTRLPSYRSFQALVDDHLSSADEELDLLEAELKLRRERLARRRRLKTENSDLKPSCSVRITTETSNGNASSNNQPLEESIKELTLGLTLPKVDIEPFDGSPQLFHIFVNSFERNVARKLSDGGQRLTYLLHYCKGPAKESIQHCVMLPIESGYEEAMRILKGRFGRPHDITQRVVRKLLDGPRLRYGSIEELHQIATDMQECLVVYSNVGKLNELDCTPYLIRIVERLPKHLQIRWAEAAECILNRGREPAFSDILNFIQQRISIASNLYGQIANSSPPPKTHLSIRTAATSYQREYRDCVLCKQLHELVGCSVFLQKSPEARIQVLKEHKRCFVCLKANHLAKDCRRRDRCMQDGCGRRHHSLLHFDALRTPLEAKTSTCGAWSSGRSVLLGCLPVRLAGPAGEVTTYAFVDNGSDATLVRRDLATKVGLNTEPCSLTVATVHGKKIIHTNQTSLTVYPLCGGDAVVTDSAYTVNDLPIRQAEDLSKRNLQRWPHLSDLVIPVLPDKSVGLLIGCDVPEAHSILEQRIGVGKQPYAVRSALGWLIRGPCGGKATNTKCVNYLGVEEESLVETLKKFYEIEFKDCGSSEDKALSVEDRDALRSVGTSILLSENKFTVGLPWRGTPKLPSNYSVARHRLELLRKRLSKDVELLNGYVAVIDSHIKKGYVSRVDLCDTRDRWFLPHHPVLNPNKPGKIRIVFDCAAKFHGHSLNNSLLSGPDVVNDLTGVLIRFRKYPVAVCADIEEMFLQVNVPASDRRYLSFLWWPGGDMNTEPAIHEINVHPFGATSSPFCVTYALRRTTEEFSAMFSEASQHVILHNFYVDDCLLSTCTVKEAVDLVGELKRMLRLGGFNLVKWNSNHPETLKEIPEDERCVSKDNSVASSAYSTLGLLWHVSDDSLQLRMNLPQLPTTRRGILACVASLYDPLGFAAPVSLGAKQLLQELCKDDVGWDTPLSKEYSERWKRWLNNVQSVNTLRIPRHLGLTKFYLAAELHVFSDASETGFGAAGYLRIIRNDSISCAFIMGKSRVAPRKITSLPRMELVAAVLSARLMKHIKKQIRIPINRNVLWSDSTIVLYYLRNTTSRFATFVANRVRLIKDLSVDCEWRHVPSENNPADVGSRGSISAKAPQMQLWLNGPEFLKQPECTWPHTHDVTPTAELLEEKTVFCAVTPHAWHSELFRKFSCWFKLQKSIAWLTRFKQYVAAKSSKETTRSVCIGPLKPKELLQAKLSIIRLVQEDRFGNSLNRLGSSGLQRFNPICIKGVWCLGGRVQGSSRNGASHPMLMPSRHPVTDLVIRSCHESNAHVGAVYVLAYLRQEYWIIKGMAQVKRVLGNCSKCKLLYSLPMGQIMAPLPLERTKTDGYPFRFCGVDYFGPFKVRYGRSDNKRYGCLFTCFQTRAVHIEIGHSLSTDSFLMTLLRFVNRRGVPEVMFSDNGSNFIGAERELRSALDRLDRNKVVDQLLAKGIEWRFNPPGASHRGGLWERIVRSVKRILSALVSEQTLSDEVLMTSMSEVEKILNDRPLVPVYDATDCINVLRPSDLLLHKALPVPINDNVTLAETYTKGWRQAQLIANTFWKRWMREYLPTLQTRSKWTRVQKDICDGDLVLLVDSEVPRGRWKKGMVIQVIPSADNHSRKVKVRTVNGILLKDIRSLCLLEGSGELSENFAH